MPSPAPRLVLIPAGPRDRAPVADVRRYRLARLRLAARRAEVRPSLAPLHRNYD